MIFETLEDYESYHHKCIKELNKANKDKSHSMMILISYNILEKAKEHDELQSIIIGYGFNAPTHYEATQKMLKTCYGIEL